MQEQWDLFVLFQQLLHKSRTDNLGTAASVCRWVRTGQIAIRHRFCTCACQIDSHSFHYCPELKSTDGAKSNDLVEVPWRSVAQFVVTERTRRRSVSIVLLDVSNGAAHGSGLADRQVHSLACALQQLFKFFVCGKPLRFPLPSQVLGDF